MECVPLLSAIEWRMRARRLQVLCALRGMVGRNMDQSSSLSPGRAPSVFLCDLCVCACVCVRVLVCRLHFSSFFLLACFLLLLLLLCCCC